MAVVAMSVSLLAGVAHADSSSPLAAKMRLMKDALKQASQLDGAQKLLSVAKDCRDNAAALAPAEVAKDPQALEGFKAEFDLLVTKAEALEQAVELPADASNRDAQIQAAIDAITAVKKDGHSKFNN